MNNFAEKILQLYKSPKYHELNAYYQVSTVYNILGLERNENRHSALLAWMLNPNESHQLGEAPLRRFLTLLAANTYAGQGYDQDKCYYDVVRKHLLTGNYTLTVENATTEQTIVGLAREHTKDFEGIIEKTVSGAFSTSSQNRFDIWMLLHISFEGADGNVETWTVPVVVENKIYSREGNDSDPERAQTVRYHRAMTVLAPLVSKDPNYCQPLMAFLSPGKTHPAHPSFIPISYQELLDYVILPTQAQSRQQTLSAETQVMLEGYVRNLSRPQTNTNGTKAKEYSILAISETEHERLESIYGSEAFRDALCAMFVSESQTLLGADYHEVTDDADVIEDFWNANEDLFKVVLYNHFKQQPDKLEVVNRIVKSSNRDTSKYLVEVLRDGQWRVPERYSKPMSKGKTVCVFFEAFMSTHACHSVQEARQFFPTSLSGYYGKRKDNTWSSVVWQRDDNGLLTDENGFSVDIYAAQWDFYESLGCAKVGSESAQIVKMWRKADFDNFLRYIQSNASIFNDIRIVAID